MKDKIPYIIITFLLIVSFNLYTSKKLDNNRYKENINALNDSIKYHRNTNNEIVASKLALQLTAKELKEQVKGSSEDNIRLKESIKKYKKVIATIQTTQSVKIDTIYQKFTDTIKEVFSKDIVVSDTWYRFNQNITNKGFKITNFEMFNKQDAVVGWKKKGLFKKPLATVEITNSNPYFKQEEIKPIIIIYNRKWHEKAFITIPIGLVLGYILGK